VNQAAATSYVGIPANLQFIGWNTEQIYDTFGNCRGISTAKSSKYDRMLARTVYNKSKTLPMISRQ